MFYAPTKDGSHVHIPDCDDFVVYHIKKSRSLKAFRLFQCHCERIDHVPKRRRTKATVNVTQRNKEQIPDDFPVIRQMIESGYLPTIPEHFYQKATSESGDIKRACMKVFKSMSKFFSHQRIHTNDKPYICPVAGCGVGFNQKGNMLTHIK